MSSEVVSDAVWAALAATAVALAATSHLAHSRIGRLSGLLHRIEANRPGYVVVMLGWMWLGWHFFAR